MRLSMAQQTNRDRIKEFLAHGAWRNLKRSDWIVLALAGVLLLVIAIPMDQTNAKKTKKAEETVVSDQEVGNGTRENQEWEQAYVSDLEKKLKQVLAQMEGVGRVDVMITISDSGERVVEKDTSSSGTTTSETDASGGNRTVTESGTDLKTVYVDTGQETYPYVQQEKLPKITGIVVVAEGGGNPTVVSNISDAVEALFSVEAHRIKVVKMCSKEE